MQGRPGKRTRNDLNSKVEMSMQKAGIYEREMAGISLAVNLAVTRVKGNGVCWCRTPEPRN